MSPPSPFVFGEASSERPPPASFTAPRRRRGAYDRADGLPVHTKGRAAGGKGPGLSPTRTAEVYEALMGREEEAAVVAVTTSTAPASGPEAAAAAAAAAGRARWTATVTAVATDAAASGRSVAGELRAVLDEAAAAAAAAAGAHPPPNADDTYPSCPPSHTAVVLPPTVRVAAATAAARVGDAPAAAAALLHNVPPRAGSGVFPHVAASILASAHLRAGRPRRALDMHLGPGGTDFGAIPATADAAVWGQVVTAAAVGGWWAEARRALRLARARGVRGLAERVYAVTLLPRPPGGGGSVGGEAAWALDLTAMMAADGVTPSTRTTVAVVSAVARGGDADAAERVAADAGLDALLAAAAEDAPPAREIGDAAVTREALHAAERGGSDAAVRTPPAAATDEVQRVAVALLAIAAARRDTPAATAIWDRLVAAVGTPNAHAAAAYVRALAHGVVPSWVASPPPPPPPAAGGEPPLPPLPPPVTRRRGPCTAAPWGGPPPGWSCRRRSLPTPTTDGLVEAAANPSAHVPQRCASQLRVTAQKCEGRASSTQRAIITPRHILSSITSSSCRGHRGLAPTSSPAHAALHLPAVQGMHPTRWLSTADGLSHCGGAPWPPLPPAGPPLWRRVPLPRWWALARALPPPTAHGRRHWRSRLPLPGTANPWSGRRRAHARRSCCSSLST